ncbi:hypothetical protein ASPWEDRAFT_175927 [Aspergillus wentii DTO 134E9]|uniref:aldehyde dehydrogenase (NAD(+)) n=1 Tax=Aspergillus wentii DTO 134E9 TaxID=1073089 RepID=A0A1L9R7H8_ASPWE|nr:uncharacterized protein ASPWEDRAFT_175927 [Aspergillus wentii DTO 134E9]OJJ30823.1 hypothetical protein ASPWEDRAFT_175927 [Aspergillus wentii DTO 134E9]
MLWALYRTTKGHNVVALSNDSRYGLMAGVFTQDINRALRLSETFDSGVVGVNCVSTIHFACPFGEPRRVGLVVSWAPDAVYG